MISESGDVVAEILAAAFHDHYERLAPSFGYETREVSRTCWGDVPEQNRALMRATVRSLLDAGLISTPVRKAKERDQTCGVSWSDSDDRCLRPCYCSADPKARHAPS